MKILHLAGGGDIGGAKSHILALVRELGKHCEVKLISLRFGDFHRDALKMGIDAEAISSGSIFADVRRIAQIIREGGYDIVHSHGSKANMASTLARRQVPFISVTTIHSDYRHDYMHSMLRKYTFGVINRLALYRMDNYIAVSHTFKKMLIERKFTPSKIHTIYNGIDFENPIPDFSREDFFRKYNIPDEEGEVLAGILARLHPVKDVATFLKAAAEALKSFPKLRFLILGSDGGQMDMLKNLAGELGIAKRVHFLGHVDAPYEVLRHLDINTLTSLSESFPYVILEGARLSKPMISTNVGGISAVVIPNVTGMLFEPGDYKKLAEHFVELAVSPLMRRTMGENLYKRVLENFSIEAMGRTHLSIYSRVLKDREKYLRTGMKYDVAISGYYGYKNSGDDAILCAIINSLRVKDPRIRISVMSAAPLETSVLYDVDSVHRFDLIKVRRLLKSVKLLIYGGGNLLQDDTSTRSLMYYLAILWLAVRTRTKTMLFASGIGPISGKLNKSISAKIVNKVDVITLRENFSYRELENLGVTAPRIEITADPVLTLETDVIEAPDSIFAAEGMPIDGKYAAVSLRDWNLPDSFARTVAAACDYLSEKHGITPVFVSMQYPEDISTSEKLARLMKRPSYIVRRKYAVAGMLSLISKMELVIGMRLHSLIYSASLSVPMIALPYEPKVDAFLSLINMPEFSVGPLDELDAEKMYRLIDHTVNNSFTIASRINTEYEIVKQKAKRNVDIVYDILADGGAENDGQKDG